MALELFRIDERLLHGQVIVGWGMRLGLQRYVVVDDDLAASEWEQDLYSAGLPPGVSATFLSVSEAVDRLPDLLDAPGRGAVITRSTSAMRELAAAGLLVGRRVNVGGLYGAPDRRMALRYVCLRRDEADDLRAMQAAGARVTARDLPTAREVGLEELLRASD
ncbi:MAG: PTS sugar transporter subunit IIB [Gemmatimonadota bacterium]|nr:PTS sugar transporter subunit IIB [Gemmatimonadota bacterium]MDH3427515.1 PTS sugar transporter subunit IIB [Gemmatimonadota bacterium]